MNSHFLHFVLSFQLILSSWLNLMGSIIRVVSALSIVDSKYRYILVISGQTLAACSQPVMLFSPTKVAALWFSENQRATANMIASVCKYRINQHLQLLNGNTFVLFLSHMTVTVIFSFSTKAKLYCSLFD